MPEAWTGDIVKQLHLNRITQKELAAELGISSVYLSYVLNGDRQAKGMPERMEQAIKAITARRAEEWRQNIQQ